MSAPTYEYVPLIADGSTFRVITIFPGKGNERIECSFLEVPTSSTPNYSALSYTWGDGDMTGYVWVHGCVIQVRDNLKNALKRLRDPEGFHHFWIDALCINQNDEAGEKKTQIPLMRHIYQNSDLVKIYLGGEKNGSGQIPSLFDRIDHVRDRPEISGNNDLFTRGPLPPNKYEELGLPHPKAKIWEDFRLLLSRDWFNRIWVIQEATLATSAEIICGQWIMNWKRFLFTTLKAHALGINIDENVAKTRSHETRPGNPLISVTQLLFFNNLKPDDSEFIPWKLIDLLHDNRTSLATIPHDYCYGLLGIAKELGDPNLTIDYTLPVEVVYRQFARYFVAQGDGVKVLYNASGHSLELPSWVPDWSHRHVSLPRIAPRSRTTSVSNRAVAAASSYPSFIRLQTANPDVLIIRGLIFDIIDDLGDIHLPTSVQTGKKTWKPVKGPKEINNMNCNALKTHSKDEKKDHMILSLIANCITELYQLLHSGPVQQYPTGEDYETVVWRTMICNFARRSGGKAPSTYVELYRSLLWLIKANDPTWQIPSSHYYDSISVEDIGKQNPMELLTNANIIIGQTAGLCSSKRRGRTGHGYIGQFSLDAQVGDYIYIPLGSAVPYVIRPGSNNSYRLIGDCYVHGVMDGEAFNISKDSVLDLDFE